MRHSMWEVRKKEVMRIKLRFVPKRGVRGKRCYLSEMKQLKQTWLARITISWIPNNIQVRSVIPYHRYLIISRCAQSYPTLCSPRDCSLPGPFVHRILQARTLESVVIPYFRRSSRQQRLKPPLLHPFTGMQILHHQRHLGSLGRHV